MKNTSTLYWKWRATNTVFSFKISHYQKCDIFFTVSLLMFCLFNLEIFAIRLFMCKSAHDNVIKNVGHPNYLIIARISHWNLFQNAGAPLMVFIRTNPLSEVANLSTVLLRLLLRIPVVTFEEENFLIAIFILLFTFNCYKTSWTKKT